MSGYISKDISLTISKKEFMRLFPRDTIIDIPKNRLKKITSGNDNSRQGSSQRISIDFLNELLKNESYYRPFLEFVESSSGFFSIKSSPSIDLKYRKVDLINAIQYIKRTGQLSSDIDYHHKIREMGQHMNYVALRENTKNTKFSFKADNTSYELPIQDILSVMAMQPNELAEFCRSEQQVVSGIPKECFFHGIIRFFDNDQIARNYILPGYIYENIKKVAESKYVDIEAINQITETTQFDFPEKKVNPGLEYVIMKGFPQDASKLEQALYIYIKMCSLLTYDEEYFAINQKGELAERHKNPDNLEKINPKHNKVVCYEFNWIYGRMLDKLGITFQNMTYHGNLPTYGKGHANLKFRCGKYLVKADAVKSILNSDLTYEKLRQKLKGIYCLNNNKDTQKEFSIALENMYNLVLKQTKDIDQKEKKVAKPDIAKLISDYKKATSNTEDVSFDDRLDILLSKLHDSGLEKTDYASYLLQLGKVLFDDKERKHNYRVYYIRDNTQFPVTNNVRLSVILSRNDTSFITNPEQTEYYYVNDVSDLKPMTKRALEYYFQEKKYEYLEHSPKIPGIETEVMSHDRTVKKN